MFAVCLLFSIFFFAVATAANKDVYSKIRVSQSHVFPRNGQGIFTDNLTCGAIRLKEHGRKITMGTPGSRLCPSLCNMHMLLKVAPERI